MKNEIPLFKFIIIIIVLLLIIGVILFNFKETYKISRLREFISKMDLIQEKVSLVRNEYKIWEDYNPIETGNFILYLQQRDFVNANSSSNIYLDKFNKIITELNENKVNYWNVNTDSIITNYCYFTPEDLNTKLRIRKHGFICNY